MDIKNKEIVETARRRDISPVKKIGEVAAIGLNSGAEVDMENLRDRFDELQQRILAAAELSLDSKPPRLIAGRGDFVTPKKFINVDGDDLRLDFYTSHPSGDRYAPSVMAKWYLPDGTMIYYEHVSAKMLNGKDVSAQDAYTLAEIERSFNIYEEN